MRAIIGLAAAFALIAALPAYADDAKPFIDQTVIDLSKILPPPPPTSTTSLSFRLAMRSASVMQEISDRHAAHGFG